MITMIELVEKSTDPFNRALYVGVDWQVTALRHEDQHDGDDRLMWGGSSIMFVSNKYRELLAPEIPVLEKAADALNKEHGYPARGDIMHVDEAFIELNTLIIKTSKEAVRSTLLLIAEPAGINRLTLDEVLYRMHFQERGGCWCRCSPAVVLGTSIYDDAGNQVDFALDVIPA